MGQENEKNFDKFVNDYNIKMVIGCYIYRLLKEPLHVFFDYSCWALLYRQDCLTIEQKLLLTNKEFIEKGSFVAKHNHKNSSAVPMDQVLEQQYNKTANEKNSVIGFSKQRTLLLNEI